MFVKKYFYKSADQLSEDKKSMYISETLQHRSQFLNDVYFNLYKDEIKQFKTIGRTALLYIGGTGEHHSASRNVNNLSPKGIMPVKSQLGYIASKTAKRLGNISYVSINSNACASAMYALKEAFDLLYNDEFDDVIIYGEEQVEPVELYLFKQLNIDLVCSDGFFILQLSNRPEDSLARISKPTWLWNDDASPFEVTYDGYYKAMKAFTHLPIDIVKMHGSGTPQNNEAELNAVNTLFPEAEKIEYKSQIGHSQGVSAGLELCILLDTYKNKNILLNASGLGNFYGSCRIKL